MRAWKDIESFLHSSQPTTKLSCVSDLMRYFSFGRCGTNGFRLAYWKLLLCGWCQWPNICVQSKWGYLHYSTRSGTAQSQRNCTRPSHGVRLFIHILYNFLQAAWDIGGFHLHMYIKYKVRLWLLDEIHLFLLNFNWK